MKKPGPEDIIYSDEVIAFLKNAADFCELLENAGSYKRQEWFGKLRVILPQLYHKGLSLPEAESIFEETNEKFVTEQQYDMIRTLAARKAGSMDDYPEVFNPDEPIEELQVTVSISEDLADIYQDLKDFLTLYHLGNNEVMNDALWEVRFNFDRYWGQKLLNVLRVIHRLITWGDLSGEESVEDDMISPSQDTSGWFISRRQKDFREDDDNSPE